MKNISSQRWFYLIGIGIGIILLTAFLSSQIFYPIILGRPKNIETPEVIGMSVSAAKRILNQKKLHTVVSDSLWTEDLKVDTIIEQKPSSGTMLKPDGTVYLVISKGSRVIEMPDLLGYSYQQAYLLLRNMGLKAVVADSMYSESYTANSVLRSSPAQGSKIKKNSTIRLYLSRGPEPIMDTASEENLYYSY